MFRPAIFTVLAVSVLSVQGAFAGPTQPASSGLTAQIDGFHGASGTGKTVNGAFASEGGR